MTDVRLNLPLLTWTFATLGVAVGWCGGAEPETSSEKPTVASISAKLAPDLQARVTRLSAAIGESSQQIGLYSQRADAYFFLGKFDEALRDYDRMVELDPEVDAGHWRRGIALFYAGRYREAAAQFERYHSFDNVDRENGIWRYLSQVKAYGRDKAREGLLKYEKDDREPFPSVYELFAGRTTPDAILAKITAEKMSNAEREKRLFYAQLYIGLNEAIEDRPEPALRHLTQSVHNTWGPTAGYGPHYMWQVGRLHALQLSQPPRP